MITMMPGNRQAIEGMINSVGKRAIFFLHSRHRLHPDGTGKLAQGVGERRAMAFALRHRDCQVAEVLAVEALGQPAERLFARPAVHAHVHHGLAELFRQLRLKRSQVLDRPRQGPVEGQAGFKTYDQQVRTLPRGRR